MLVVGAISGTSADAIDLAAIETDGVAIARFGPRAAYPYDDDLRDAVLALARTMARGGALDRDVDRAVGDAFASAIARFCAENALRPTLIGFHGQTVFHDPRQSRTVQLGDPQRTADRLGVATIGALREADMEAGGEGAPIAPLYHAALVRGADLAPCAVLNLGGVGNVTAIGLAENDVRAFDTGPANALLDEWSVRRLGAPFDRDGALAATGRIDQARLAQAMAAPFFAKNGPKSLDRHSFSLDFVEGLAPADGAATLLAFTIETIVRAADAIGRPARWLVCGGGRRNGFLMAQLRRRLAPASVEPVEAQGFDGDALEAEAMAFLAARQRRGLPTTLPSTTGCARPVCGGRLFTPSDARP